MTDEPKKRRGRPAGSKNKPKDGAAPKARSTPRAPRKATRASSQGQTTENNRVHWHDLTDDEQHALVCRHSRAIGEAEGRREVAKKAVNSAKDLARADIGKDALHRIKTYNDLQTDAGQARLREQLDMQMQVARWAGMPTKQGDLFEDNDPTPVEDRYYADGKRAGLAGEAGSPPSNLTGPHQQKWMAGWHDGQAVLSKGFKPLDEKKTAAAPKADAAGSVRAKNAHTESPQVDWFAVGAQAFNDGKNDLLPADVPEEHHSDWKTGYDKAKAAKERRETVTDWKQQGRLHRRNGGGCSIPDAVPEAHRQEWHDAWREEDAAMQPRQAAAN